MIKKLLCKTSYVDYFIAGKAYPVVEQHADGQSVVVLDETGDQVFVFIAQSSFGVFEPIIEEAE